MKAWQFTRQWYILGSRSWQRCIKYSVMQTIEELRDKNTPPTVESLYLRLVPIPHPPSSLHGLSPPATARSVIPGAFMLEDMHLGTMVIPAGAKLIRVGDTIVGDMSFDEAKNVALSATVRSEFVFE